MPTNAQDDSQTSDAEQTNLLVGNNSGLSDEVELLVRLPLTEACAQATTVRTNAMQGTVQGVYGGERRNTLVVLVTMACCNVSSTPPASRARHNSTLADTASSGSAGGVVFALGLWNLGL